MNAFNESGNQPAGTGLPENIPSEMSVTNNAVQMLNNIPAELRALHQWVAVDMSINPETGKPSKRPINPRSGNFASVTDSSSWGSFEDALGAGGAIGFVLTANDPYTIIDLDNKPEKPATPEQIKRHHHILDAFASYTERSVSGSGYHIIVKGLVTVGVHRDNVEIYSNGRYMVCTGNVVRQAPIIDCQAMLDTMFSQMQPKNKVKLDEDYISDVSDAEIVDRAMSASNGDKFTALCNGDQSEYPSQSEADFALLSIIAFYTKDNEQVRRIFRMTALGKRDKANRNDNYIDLALSKIRAQEKAIEHDVSILKASFRGFPSFGKERIHSEAITFPPGLMGELAQYFYSTAVRPVPEIALGAAIGLMAGVAGRGYNISNTGLNQYLVIVAKTGSGKEGASAGIDQIITAVRPSVPMISDVRGPGDFASGQALIKTISRQPCFVSVLGEFGLTLQQITSPRANTAQLMLRKVLLDLYTKSGAKNVLGQMVYSDSDKNTATVRAPNLSILAESTPSTLFEGLDARNIADGLIPRFIFIEYKGDRPSRNERSGFSPSPDLVKAFVNFLTASLNASNNEAHVAVAMDEDAINLTNEFDRYADGLMNASKNEVEIQVWNRAHLHVLKLAALVAVGCNHHKPKITIEMAAWSINIIKRSVASVMSHFEEGEAGGGDEATIVNVLRKKIGTYMEENKSNGVFPQSTISTKTAGIKAFKLYKLGANNAMKMGLKILEENGEIVRLNAAQTQQITRRATSAIHYRLGDMWGKIR